MMYSFGIGTRRSQVGSLRNSHSCQKAASPPTINPPNSTQIEAIGRRSSAIGLSAADNEVNGKARMLLVAAGVVNAGMLVTVFCDGGCMATLELTVAGFMAVVIVLATPPIVAVNVSVRDAVALAVCTDDNEEDPAITVLLHSS